MSEQQKLKATKFLALHQTDGCFLMPNAWDAGSAKMLFSVGFEAVGTTSAGIAFSRGKPDNVFCSPDARLQRDDMLREIQHITNAIPAPVNADLEGGFGDSPEEVAETIRGAIEAGAVGGNIEDYTGIKERPLYDMELAVERIATAREAIDASGIPFVLVARTDRFNIGKPGGFDEAVDQANRYREAGADCLFAPGVSDLDKVKKLVREIQGPVNVVMGLSGSNITLSQLRDVGVRRVSIGGSLARALYYQIRNAAIEMLEHGTFSFAEKQIPQSELNQIFESNMAK